MGDNTVVPTVGVAVSVHLFTLSRASRQVEPTAGVAVSVHLFT